jgi:hypothetical protein
MSHHHVKLYQTIPSAPWLGGVQGHTTRQNGNFGLSVGLIFALTNGRFKWHTKLRDNINDATQQL